MQYLEMLEKYEPKALHNQVPIVWDYAGGFYVYSKFDSYIDFTSGIFVANAGHNPYSVRKAIEEQATRLLHSYTFANRPRALLVKKLAEISGMDKVLLETTGTDAIEAAIRMMGGDPDYIVGFEGSFHGRTLGARSIFRLPLTAYPTTPDFVNGIIFETYTGYNAQFHPKEWVQAWCSWAKEYNIPVCFDEIQAGFGRTGKMFGFEHYDVKPDLIVVGKALSGGLPISAVMGRADLLDSLEDPSSTHMGNPVCCAAALANIELIEEDGLVERAARFGEWLEAYLPELFPEYKIWGKGMVWALDIGDNDLTNRIVEGCAEKRLLLLKTHRGTIKIGAPLTIHEDTMKDGLQIIREVIDEVVV